MGANAWRREGAKERGGQFAGQVMIPQAIRHLISFVTPSAPLSGASSRAFVLIGQEQEKEEEKGIILSTATGTESNETGLKVLMTMHRAKRTKWSKH